MQKFNYELHTFFVLENVGVFYVHHCTTVTLKVSARERRPKFNYSVHTRELALPFLRDVLLSTLKTCV